MGVMKTDGTPVDWSRADRDGNYSVVLPGPGRYLVLANGQGWARGPKCSSSRIRPPANTSPSPIS